QVEGGAQFIQRRVRDPRMGDRVQQLAGRFLGGHAARGGRQGFVLAGLLQRAQRRGEGATQRLGRGQGAVAQRGGDRGEHPQHAPGVLVGGVLQQLAGGGGQQGGVARGGAFRPGGHRLLEAGKRGGDQVLALRPRQRGRLRQLRRQRRAQVRREQHALAEPRGATGGADVVEQRQ